MDPVELRRVNDIDAEPVNGAPYTSRSLMECYDAAGEAFGWSDYDPAIGAFTDGDDLVGWGCATAAYPTQMAPCAVRVHFDDHRQGAGEGGQPRRRHRRLYGAGPGGGRTRSACRSRR